MTIPDAETPWAMRVTALADRLAGNLDDREYLTSVGARVIQIAREQDCSRMVGVSESGRRIVAAAERNPVLGIASGSKVLLVDGLLATGTNLLAAADRVRQDGAAGIAVVAALAEPSAISAAKRELKATVIALEIAGDG